MQTVQEVSKKSLQGAAEVLVAAGDMATDAAKVSATLRLKTLRYLHIEKPWKRIIQLVQQLTNIECSLAIITIGLT